MACRQYQIQSSTEYVSPTVESVIDFIKSETSLTVCECIRDIKVVLNELLANAIIHGNGSLVEKPVDLKIEVLSDRITVKITDRGPAFKPAGDEEADILNENGRGISICHILCRKLDYSFEEGKGNSATAVFYIKDEGG